MDTFKTISDWVSLISNSLTIVASLIAIFVFFTKGKEIKTAFSMLLNWSFQLTLTDLRSKIDRLNEYNANDASDIDEIRNILHEIAGQIRGNPRLAASAPKISEKIERLANSKKFTEPLKRSVISEIRETLRNIEVNSITSDLK